ncbi:hypothetical protein BV22DRAFT_146504 [Leucogyrophana mollusca]|uniref:Uncharacterized protein n=1 Tax=Leucogyrophana mollusca TaxID=85980 RepID=A0ACB8BWD7_9AGAM|nr:hypothetical protein BV22DRAFT_146504 [Leucogyrophana mollusca]
MSFWYRYAESSGPLPWVGFSEGMGPVDSDVSLSASSFPTEADSNAEVPELALTEGLPDESWTGYPENLFKSWSSQQQVKQSQLRTHCPDARGRWIYQVDIMKNRSFVDCPRLQGGYHYENTSSVIQEKVGRVLCFQYRGLITCRSGRRVTMSVLTRSTDIASVLPSTRTMLSNGGNTTSEQTSHTAGPSLGDGHSSFASLLARYVSSLCFACTDPIFASPRYGRPRPLADSLAIHIVRTALPSRAPSSRTSRMSIQVAHLPRPYICWVATLSHARSVYWDKMFCTSDDPAFVPVAILWYTLYA